MKKNFTEGERSISFLKKLFMQIKIGILLILAGISSAFAGPAYSQIARISLEANNARLETVLDEIESKSEFYFIFNQKQINVDRTVSFKAENELIDKILSNIFSGTEVNYEVFEKKILLTTDPISESLKAKTVNNGMQQQTITGKVIDSQSGQSLPGVNIVIKGTTIGILTDVDGQFSLTVPDLQATLLFSFIGYTSQEVPIAGQKVLNIRLIQSLEALDEVVVVGYGTQKKVSLTGAVSSVNTEQLTQVSVGDAISRLEGNVTGVTITNNWRPGAGTSVRVRGVGSMRSNDPLYVVDGVPRTGFDNIDPNDIESMTVLKDASSAAIYGTRAANGVILITTKRGREGKPRVSFNGRHGFQFFDPNSKPDLMSSDEWLANMKQKWINMGLQPGQAGWGDSQLGLGEPRIPDYIMPAGKMEGDVNESTYTPPQVAPYNAITRAHMGESLYDLAWTEGAPIDEYNLSMSGGSQGANFAISAGYMNQKGLFNFAGDDINPSTNFGFTRYTLRANSDFNVKKWLKISPDLSATHMIRRGSTSSGGDVLNWNPLLPIYDIQGNFAGTKIPLMGNGHNPIAELVRNDQDRDRRINIQSSLSAQITFAKGLVFRSLIGASYRTGMSTDYSLMDPEWNQTSNTTYLTVGSDRAFQYNLTNTLNYIKTMGDHSITLLAGLETVDISSENLSGSRSTYAFENYDYMVLDAGEKDVKNSGTFDANRLFSYFGRFNYDFKGKYLVEGVIRRDASSRFIGKYRWGTFPAFSVGWRISEETFFKDNVPFVSSLKIRAGWGKNGNDNVGNYNAYSAFGATDTRSFYNITGSSRSSVSAGFSKLRTGNPEARWETGLAKNIGLDVSLLKSKIEVVIDVFDRRTIDMLYRDTKPGVWGLVTLPDRNIGEMKNVGYEIAVTYNGKITEDISFRVRGNASHFKNEVVKLNGNPTEIFYSNSTEAGYSTATMAGKPMASFYGYVFEGFFNNAEDVAAWPKFNPTITGLDTYSMPGVMKFKDVNEDGVITGADRTFFGHGYPKLTYGVNLGMNYKSFDFTFNLTGVYGRNLINNSQRTLMFIRNDGNYLSRRLYESWTAERYANGEKITVPITINKDANMQLPSSWFMDKGDYIRLRDIQLGYRMPKSLMTKLDISSVRVFFQVNNLFTITKYKGQNPEVSENGVDGNVYPTPRVFTFGINLDL